MHTAICSFDDRATAEQARDRLLQTGFDRQDVHLQHGGSPAGDLGDGDPREDPRAWDGSEREVAVNRDFVESVAGFFGRLFGSDTHPHHGTYAGAAGRGRFVLVVDAETEGQAQRARDVMHGLQAGDLNVVHRPTQRPLRELLGVRPATADPKDAIPAAWEDRSSAWQDRSPHLPDRSPAVPERQPAVPDRAMAADDPQRPRAQREDDTQEPVGLRYADQDDLRDRPKRPVDGARHLRRDD
jgi:hypothetical protein